MFKGQPKGLYALSLANTGERFGYYTMLAIFTLFLQAKFGYTEAVTTQIYGIFLAAVYFMPFFGGILAVSMVPTILCSPLGGVLADRVPRQRIMWGLDFFTAALVAGYGLLFAGGHSVAAVGGMMVLLSAIPAAENTMLRFIPHTF